MNVNETFKVRRNSPLDLHNELIINLFNRFSNNLKFTIRETKKGSCLFVLKLTPEKYESKDTMIALAQIMKIHMPDLNNSKIVPLFNLILLIIDYLIQDLKNSGDNGNNFFDDILDYSFENPLISINSFWTPGNNSQLNIAVSFKFDDFSIDVADCYYESYFRGKPQNYFLKYLNFCLYHICS